MSTASSVMNQAKVKPKLDENTHEVQPGETIESIAALYKTSVLNLVRWNDLEYAQVQPGQLLILSPGLKASIAVRSVADSNTELKKAPSVPEFHFVKPGETLFAISRLYNMEVDELKRINSLTNNAIRAGQKLKLK
jgi:LysM repeat protein